MKPSPLDILDSVNANLSLLTLQGADCRDIYVAVHAFDLAIADEIESQVGPAEVAGLQGIANRVRAIIHPKRVAWPLP